MGVVGYEAAASGLESLALVCRERCPLTLSLGCEEADRLRNPLLRLAGTSCTWVDEEEVEAPSGEEEVGGPARVESLSEGGSSLLTSDWNSCATSGRPAVVNSSDSWVQGNDSSSSPQGQIPCLLSGARPPVFRSREAA